MGITDRGMDYANRFIISVINALSSTHSADKASKLEAMEHMRNLLERAHCNGGWAGPLDPPGSAPDIYIYTHIIQTPRPIT